MSSDLPTQSGSQPPERRRREQARQIALVGLGALVVLFAVLNLDGVKVDWVVGSGRTPLIVVIVVSALIGALIDRIVQRRQAKR